MVSHTAAEAIDAVWTGTCDRHDGDDPERCGAVDDVRTYRNRYDGIECWYLGD